MNTRFKRLILVLILIHIVLPIYAAVPLPKRFQGGFSLGLGLPKIPFSHFRSPVSILGGGMINYRLSRKVGLQLEGGGLTTLSLGTAGNENGELKFNMLWSAFDLQYRVRGGIRNESLICAGPGYYQLDQQFDQDKDNLGTPGINLGFIGWSLRNKWTGVFDLRWHLLFKPDNNPQILTMSFGILF